MRRRERGRNIQSPRTVGAPTAALTATSTAISDETMKCERDREERRKNQKPGETNTVVTTCSTLCLYYTDLQLSCFLNIE